MKYFRVGAHTLVDLLYSPSSILNNRKIPPKIAENGNVVHLKLGYVGSETFKKYYRLGDYLIEVIGSPDKINYKDGCVEELKTYSSERSRENQIERGKLQLIFYSWLTGLECARLVLYDTVNNRMEIINYNFTEKEINEILEKAIKKYIEIREVLSKQ